MILVNITLFFMKNHFLLKSSLFLLGMTACGFCNAESFYAQGVTATSGWLDANKAYNPAVFFDRQTGQADEQAIGEVFAKKDYSLCWAATASNILQYMQVQAGGTISYSATYAANSGSSQREELLRTVRQFEIFETFTANFQDVGYNAENGMAWFTTGSTAYDYGATGAPPLENGASQGGFYSSLLGTGISDFQSNVLASHYQMQGSEYAGNYVVNDILNHSVTYADLLHESLASGPIALGINTKDGDAWGQMGHAITCWGFETGADGTVTALYVTDSDDGQEILKTLNTTLTADGLLALSSETLISNAYDRDGQLIGSYSTNYNDYYLTDFSSYHNFFFSIPEPSTATLSLLGFTALCLRRRRTMR